MDSKSHKNQNTFKIIMFVLVLAVSAAVFAFRGKTGTYRVVEVYDGDTVVVDMQGAREEIRFIGVDTPETKDPRKPVQCFGPEASIYTHKTLQPGTRVRLVADPTNSNRDRYGRLLRYIYLQDGTLYNESLIKQGYGRAYTGFLFEKVEQFNATEAVAKASGKGLWRACPVI